MPVFINQITSEGAFNEVLFILNFALIEHCKKNNYNCIDLQKKLIGKQHYWWDGVHTTPKGSQEIVNLIFPELLKFLNN